MNILESKEYLCPHCGGVNVLPSGEHDSFKEALVKCTHCKKTINVIAVNGIDDSVNIVAFEHDDAVPTR
jgi:transcription elongation factor Elf1